MEHMVLIIGGAFQGKTEYARERFPGLTWADGRSCTEEELCRAGGVHHFHAYIERALKMGEDVTRLGAKLLRENSQAVVVTDEIGYGIVPLDAFQREYREVTGRICTELAKEASPVIRVVCGIGTVIKG